MPNSEITGSMLDALIVYVAILGVLLLISTWIRLKVSILKRYHIPASLLAGIIGLILGPFFLGIIPKEITDCWSALSGRLIVFVFAPMLMGRQISNGRALAKKAAASVCWSWAATCIQYAVPIFLSVLLLTPLFGVDPLFATILEQGWSGGHGTAGGMGLVFEELGWLDGQSLSVTSATFGLIFGVVGGIIIINIAVKKGWTTFISTSASLKGEETELYVGEEKPVDTHTAVNSSVIDNMAFHAALICVAVLLGWILNWALKTYLGFSVSWFVTALFGGLILWQLIKHTSWANAVDEGTFSRIQGLSLEFLVAGAVASVNVPVVVEYMAPLLIQQSVMVVVMLFMNLWFARRIFGKYWFENSMVLFGTYTGVAATGLLLLKTCDPEMKSDAVEVFAARAPFCSWALGGGVLTSMTPGWIVQYGAFPVGVVYLIAFAVFFILPRIFGMWHVPKKQET